jgi:hypothetical protein
MEKYSLFIFSVSFWPFLTQKKPEADGDLRFISCLEIQHWQMLKQTLETSFWLLFGNHVPKMMWIWMPNFLSDVFFEV